MSNAGSTPRERETATVGNASGRGSVKNGAASNFMRNAAITIGVIVTDGDK